MRYELLLQSADASLPFDPGVPERLLESRGMERKPDGTGVWKLKHGEVETRRLMEGGVCIAIELRAPLGEKTDLVRELVVVAVMLADEARLNLFDPQLSRKLSLSDEAAVAENFMKTSRWAGEYLGVPEAIAASFPAPQEQSMPRQVKFAIAIGVVLLIVYLVVRDLLEAIQL